MKFVLVLLALVSSALAYSVPEFSAVPWEQSLPQPEADELADEFNTRIVSGHAAATNQFPHQVSVRSTGICGGSLLNGNWVLTAAHCTVGQTSFTLRFGSINMVSGGVVQQIAVRLNQNLINHPAFNSANLNNDIALIRTASPLTYSPAIRAVRLPTRAQASATFAGVLATVSGWGATVHGGGAQTLMRWVNVRVITNDLCRQTFPAQNIVIPSVICTTGTTGNQSTCGGDSGGPLIIDESGTPTQIGIVAFGAPAWRGGCSAGHPAGFVRTASFLTWINQHTGLPIRG